MRADVLQSHIYPARIEMTDTKQIQILHIYSPYESKLKDFLVKKTLLQIFFTDDDESKGIIVNKFSTEEDESECVHKNINKPKYAKNEAEYERF